MSQQSNFMSNMVSGPTIEFDDVSGSRNTNEHFTFDMDRGLYFGQPDETNTLDSMSDASETTATDVLLRYLCAYSNGVDSNEESRNLVLEYRNSLLQMLGEKQKN